MQENQIDIAILGAGAAGLMAAIQAAQAAPELKIALFDGAKKPGAKILVAGGGRCNVTHYKVSADDFAGSSIHSIKKVLGRFTVEDTRHFFTSRGVDLKQEETGKLFPVSDKAGDVLHALLSSCDKAGVMLYKMHRLTSVDKSTDRFILRFENAKEFTAKRLIMATGGKSLPKTGSDGIGYVLAQRLGHSLTSDIFPALVPLTLNDTHLLCSLSGTSFKARLTLQNKHGKNLIQFTNSLLCAHFGLTGPVVLDISRYYLHASRQAQEVELCLNMLPDIDTETLKSELTKQNEKRQVSTILQNYLPNRLVSALLGSCEIQAQTRCAELNKHKRQKLLEYIYNMPLAIIGDRGFKVAEVTAGGILLNEVNIKTMQSRICPGLYFCGEILDVDGRIGGFNFQWAWASGYTAGVSAAQALTQGN